MKKEISTECAECHRDFIALVECDDVLEYPVNLIPNYCEFCEKEMKTIGNGWMGTITAASIPQRNVEGLEESLQTLATSIVHSQNATDESIGKLKDDFRAFKKHAEYDIEQNTNNITETRETLHSTINLTFEQGKKIEELNKQNHNRFAEINHIEYIIIPKIRTLLIALHIMVLGLFIFDLGVVWYIIKH